VWTATLAMLALAFDAAQGQTHTNSAPLLLHDRLGRTVHASTNEVNPVLLPPPSTGLSNQIPTAPKGTPQSEEIHRRILESKTGREWLPPTPPVLMPYLANLDEYGNTAIQPGAVFPVDPLSKIPQAGKYAASDVGLRYAFYQSLTMVSMTEVNAGASALQYYTATFAGKWAVTEMPDASRASWISTEANVQLGLSPASRNQTPAGNLGTVVNPQATVFGPNGIWLSELAWQQSLLDGRLVFLAGQVDQSNYIDANTYANNSQGQFLNSAFVNSQVLPFSFNNLGLNLQYQPNGTWYALAGMGALNQNPGQSPFQNLGFNNWSYLLEFGLTPTNFIGLGSGVYRVQPFIATVQGHTQCGVGLNLQQQLGATSPWAWFGRFGVGGMQVTLNGAAAQVASGFALQGPLACAGLFPKQSNDYLGAGVFWSRPSGVMAPVVHDNEYGFELTYVLQLTPLASIQPDLQMIWDPVNNQAARSLVFQLQLNLTW
jgi:porin